MPEPDVTARPSRQARQEFARALAEQNWSRPAVPRPATRPHIVLMVAIAAAAGAIVAGVVLQLIHPARLPTAASRPPAQAPGASFTAVSGWDCVGGGAGYGFVARRRTGARTTVASGGWAQNGCHGAFETIPVSGSPAAGHPRQLAEWWFSPGATMTRCAVMVFRPALRRQDLLATAAQFYVLAGRDGARLRAGRDGAPGFLGGGGNVPGRPGRDRGRPRRERSGQHAGRYPGQGHVYRLIPAIARRAG